MKSQQFADQDLRAPSVSLPGLLAILLLQDDPDRMTQTEKTHFSYPPGV